MTALRIPDRWSEVTAEWMAAALAGRFPGAEVASATLRWASDGTNRRARFGLRYSRGAGPVLPAGERGAGAVAGRTVGS